MVFDSPESLTGRVTKKNWEDICDAITKELEQSDSHDITSFNIGRGGATPSLKFIQDKYPARPKDYRGIYRDSHRQYKVWTQSGVTQ